MGTFVSKHYFNGCLCHNLFNQICTFGLLYPKSLLLPLAFEDSAITVTVNGVNICKCTCQCAFVWLFPYNVFLEVELFGQRICMCLRLLIHFTRFDWNFSPSAAWKTVLFIPTLNNIRHCHYVSSLWSVQFLIWKSRVEIVRLCILDAHSLMYSVGKLPSIARVPHCFYGYSSLCC